MPLTLVTIPCLEDNYAFLIHNAETGETGLVDIPEAAPINAELAARGWSLDHILITHHHWDHVDGLADLNAAGAKIYGAKPDAERLPPLTNALTPGDSIAICGTQMQVIDVPGHTIGHVAFYFPTENLIFTADSLMAMGCGRLFEGTPEVAFDTLQRLAALPGETIVASGHEYTATNIEFAKTVESNNLALRARDTATRAANTQNVPTVPSTLADELATNPFLRCHSPEIRANLGLETATDVAVFTELRRRRNEF